MLNKFTDWLVGVVNNYKVKKKLYILYFFCMLIPLLITDGVIISNIINSDLKDNKRRQEDMTSAVSYTVNSAIENAVSISKSIYVNSYINNFLEYSYSSPIEYYNSYLDFMRGSLFRSCMGNGSVEIKLYADNSTLIGGGSIGRLDTAQTTAWYQALNHSGKDIILYVSTIDDQGLALSSPRISLIRFLNDKRKGDCKKLVKLDLDYNRLKRDIEQMKYQSPIYIFNDKQLLLTNTGKRSSDKIPDVKELIHYASVTDTINKYGAQWQIYVMNSEDATWSRMKNVLPLGLCLVFLNVVMPWLFMKILTRSFTNRFWELSVAFEDGNVENLKEIDRIQGTDELGMLMRNYNRMARRINELIETVYKERLREQESDIARKNAELLALHSQINPHFLFNALESVRMHSILKEEFETAHIVEKLALLERQYVDWGSDMITVQEEMEFVEAYLELQKYRFGKRLSYSLDMDEGCMDYRIARLTLVTFVENACIHGIEGKPAGGWIFVRVYTREDQFYLEVEDTGKGMEQEEVHSLLNKMQNVGIYDLKQQERVGIMNACLRLKIMTENTVQFELESEKGAGTIVTVNHPIKFVSGSQG
ncbi:histidine kinase [Clostridium sp. E02]|uniref:sensor histidine kinase n=1 Tax=Clostridium sp. E02 TaxID=2487134 RepID=UPI0013DD8C52|nr:histidine kinase [Clostridium sp. E02]